MSIGGRPPVSLGAARCALLSAAPHHARERTLLSAVEWTRDRAESGCRPACRSRVTWKHSYTTRRSSSGTTIGWLVLGSAPTSIRRRSRIPPRVARARTCRPPTTDTRPRRTPIRAAPHRRCIDCRRPVPCRSSPSSPCRRPPQPRRRRRRRLALSPHVSHRAAHASPSLAYGRPVSMPALIRPQAARRSVSRATALAWARRRLLLRGPTHGRNHPPLRGRYQPCRMCPRLTASTCELSARVLRRRRHPSRRWRQYLWRPPQRRPARARGPAARVADCRNHLAPPHDEPRKQPQLRVSRSVCLCWSHHCRHAPCQPWGHRFCLPRSFPLLHRLPLRLLACQAAVRSLHSLAHRRMSPSALRRRLPTRSPRWDSSPVRRMLRSHRPYAR